MNKIATNSTIAFIVFAVTLFSSESNATQIKRISLDDLHNDLGAIYIADILNIDTLHGYNNLGFPATKVVLRVSNAIAGPISSGEEIEFILPEGNINESKLMIINNTAKFSSGASYLIMQRHGPWHRSPVYGWDTGFFRITYNFNTGHDILVDNQGGCFVGLSENGILRSPSMFESPYYTIGTNNNITIEERTKRYSESFYYNDEVCMDLDSAVTIFEDTFFESLQDRFLVNESALQNHSLTEIHELDEDLNPNPGEEYYETPPICDINPLLIQCKESIFQEEIF